MTDVEMAQDEVGTELRRLAPRRRRLTPRRQVFAGPMSESVPTSVSSFAHRRARADSNASFAYYDPRQDAAAAAADDDDDAASNDAVVDDFDPVEEEDEDVDEDYEEEDEDYEEDYGLLDLEARPPLRPTKRPSAYSASASVEAPLLRRHSRRSVSSVGSHGARAGRTSQKIYMATEDVTIVVAGFRTSRVGLAAYAALCAGSAGLAWLLLRWLPHWRVGVVGRAAPLRDCDWVVVENQWGELAVLDVGRQRYGRALSTVFGDADAGARDDFDEDADPVLGQLRTVDYRYVRFCYHPLKDKFVVANAWRDPAWTDVAALRQGIDSDEHAYRALVFGRNLIDVEEKATGQILVDEVFHPFYVFQMASLVLWSLDKYYYYAACILVISVASITTALLETKATMQRLRAVSRFECDVRVLRDGFWRPRASPDLVPGDVFEVTDPHLGQLPCDSVLLSGDCIVNESMLTGESVPVSKLPLTGEALAKLQVSASAMHPDVAKHVLFCGTKMVRARRPHDDGGDDDEAAALAMVIRTGFHTTKGALVRSMLFPKPSGFKFYRDSMRYISVMAGIAVVCFVASLVNFVRLGLAWHLILVRALDLITIVVPPALPATLTIGTTFALSRLKKQNIFCISPQRVNVGGKLDVVCFDKTGTLTEDGLDVLGVRVVQRPARRFSDMLTTAADVLPDRPRPRHAAEGDAARRAMVHTMATCHSLRNLGGELVGDPLDVKMFRFTGWAFEEKEQGSVGDDGADHKLSPSVARPPAAAEHDAGPPLELGVLKSFEFVSQLRRASVVVRQFGSPSGDVYVKGAPECIKAICRADSFPADYDEVLAHYTHRGFRVIACATKRIAKLNWLKVQKMQREQAEGELDFTGFIVFENKLKPTTRPVIEELDRAGIRTVMCTGDNILTAISVARECRLVDPAAHCFVPHFAHGDARSPLARVRWESVDDARLGLDELTLRPLPAPAPAGDDDGDDASGPFAPWRQRTGNYSLAVPGDVFRWMVDFGPERALREVVVRGQVFARMSPDEKHELVEKLQAVDYSCGFCGDGANDCGALKAADVGISLSEAEASVAAPFTSRVFDIGCVPVVVKEGRAALVTSFSCFKFMSVYSAIQFTSVSVLYASASNLGDVQFLFIDLVLVLPLALFMGWAAACPQLARRRPTARLVSAKVLVPLLGQIALCALVQLAAYAAVRRQAWFAPPVVDRHRSSTRNSANTALFLVSSYQYVLAAVVLSGGAPFRQPLARNRESRPVWAPPFPPRRS